MHQLRLLAGGTHNAHNGVIRQPRRAADPSQATAFAMSLQDLSNLFWRHLTMVVQGVKPFIERLLAPRTEVPLATVRGKARVCVY